MFLGPRRFSDLAKGLPGLAPNLPTARLRGLEEAGLVEREVLPSPANATVYRLTDEGARLEEPMIALMRWGTHHMVEPPAGEAVRPELALIFLRAAFVAEEAAGADVDYEMVLDDLVVGAEVRDGSLELTAGVAEPSLRVRMPLRTFAGLADAHMDLGQPVADGLIAIEGEPAEIGRFLRIFGRFAPSTTSTT